jgi:hypothetical protein
VNFQNTGSINGDQEIADPKNFANLFGLLPKPIDLDSIFDKFKFGGTQ